MKTHPKQAYELIRKALEDDAEVRLISSKYDEQFFGNFLFAYWRGERAASIVSDRGQIFVCDDLEAEKGCRMVAELFDSDEHKVLEDLRPAW